MKFNYLHIALFLLLILSNIDAQKTSVSNSKKQMELQQFQSNRLQLDELFKQGVSIKNYQQIAYILSNIPLLDTLYDSEINLTNYFENYINHSIVSHNLEQAKINKLSYRLSKLYKDLNQTDQQFQQLEAIINSPVKDLFTCLAYTDIASLLVNIKADPYGAFEYLNTAFADKNLMSTLDHELLVRLKFIYVFAKKDQSNLNKENRHDLEVVQSHMTRIEQYFHRSNIAPIELSNMYNNVGMLQESSGNLHLALELYEKVYHSFVEQKDSFRMFHALNNVGSNAAELQNLSLAKSCYDRIYNESSDIEQRSTAYANLAYYLFDENPIEKLPYFYKAISLLSGTNYQDISNFKLPDLERTLQSDDPTTFPIYFTDLSLAYIQIFNKTKHPEYLEKALETLELIEKIYDVYRYNSLNEKTKLYWINKGVTIHSMGVEISFLLNDPASAFRNMEKNKALLLQENIKTFQSRIKQDIPRALLEKEYNMYYALSSCSQKLQNNPDSESLKEEFYKKNSYYKSFMDSLESSFPNYVKSKKDIRTINLDHALKEFVSEQENLVEYIMNKNKAYGIFCSIEGNILFEIENIHEVQLNLKKMDSLLLVPIMKSETIEDFQRLSHELFNALFPFENASALLKDRKLRIIPDQNLRKLPFEALCFDPSLKLPDAYLVNLCEISYLQSISVYKQLELKNNNPSKKLLAISPDKFLEKSLSPLNQSTDLIEGFKTYDKSKIYQSTKATKNNFLHQLSQYEILHINTHAGLDSVDQTPWLAFYDEIISWNELFGKENHADLVVLDACKTNDGKLASGEGILNLSRSFFYNGTRSVLSSFWNVNERAGNKIISGFYQYLEQGNSKSKALQQSKMDYLREHQYSEILPYYWATFTLTGNNNPIVLNKKKNATVIPLISLVGIILIGVFYWKIKPN